MNIYIQIFDGISHQIIHKLYEKFKNHLILETIFISVVESKVVKMIDSKIFLLNSSFDWYIINDMLIL